MRMGYKNLALTFFPLRRVNILIQPLEIDVIKHLTYFKRRFIDYERDRFQLSIG